MLSIAAMTAGQEKYYSNLAREDYYLQGGEPPGLWLGTAPKALGLPAKVEAEHLRNLFSGHSADGKRSLVQNAGKKKRQPGWDLTFSAPKTVSVFWSQSDEATRRIIQDCHLAAVKDAVAYLEEVAAFTRRGKGGKIHELVKLLVAAFEHSTSRALDPQLHTHCLILNLVLRADGTTGTLLSKLLYQHKMTAGALYRASLANALEQRLGLTIERHKTWFELAGVPKALAREFSKRRRAIEKALAAFGLESASAAAIATLATREKKIACQPGPNSSPPGET